MQSPWRGAAWNSVLERLRFGNQTEHWEPPMAPFQFLCPDVRTADGECLRIAQSKPLQHIWKGRNVTVDHCMSQVVDELCTVRTSLSILIMVIICNLLKAVSMVLALRTVLPSPLLVTVGDAVACMLEDPDSKTDGMSAKAEFNPSGWAKPTTPQGGFPYKPRAFKWYQSVSRTRWRATIVVFVVALSSAGGLLHVGLSRYKTLGIPKDLHSL